MPDPTTGVLSVELKTSAGAIAYRLRGATFNVTPVGATMAAATINTEDNPDATSVQRQLPPGLNNVFLTPGWRLEKEFSAGSFKDVPAQLVSGNPATVTITEGQITNTSFAFQTDGGEVITVGTGTLNLTIEVLDQSLLPDVTSASTSGSHTCVVLAGGAVRCWGMGLLGGLGYGNTNDIGDNETPASAGDVNVGGPAAQVTAGGSHVRADDQRGGALLGLRRRRPARLRQHRTRSATTKPPPPWARSTSAGRSTQIAAGGNHTCALLTTRHGALLGARGRTGSLGYGNTNNIGDNETPGLGRRRQRRCGPSRRSPPVACTPARCSPTAPCAAGVTASSAQLGYGNTNDIGDNETPGLGRRRQRRRTRRADRGRRLSHLRAPRPTGAMRCWGLGLDGQLGYGNANNIGDNELPSSVLPIPMAALGTGAFTAAQIVAGERHTCARSNSNVVRCWGAGGSGQLGYGTTTNNIGDNESVGGILGAVSVGGTPVSLAAGSSANHTCAILATGALRCWGLGTLGQLGYANTNNIGDNESPAVLGNVVVVTTAAAPKTTLPSSVTITMNIVGTGAVNEGGFTCSTGNVGVCSIKVPIGTGPLVVNADRAGGSWTGAVCAPQGSGNPSTDGVILVHLQRDLHPHVPPHAPPRHVTLRPSHDESVVSLRSRWKGRGGLLTIPGCTSETRSSRLSSCSL